MSQPRNRFTVPVFPHVKKFILKKYGGSGTLSKSGALKTEEYTTLGKMVTLSLRDVRRWTEYNNRPNKQLSESIVLQLTGDQLKLGPKMSKLLRLNVDMDREFKSHLVSWINAGNAMGVAPFTICKMYLAWYQIDEKEYSLDAAYKYYQRISKGESEEDSQ